MDLDEAEAALRCGDGSPADDKPSLPWHQPSRWDMASGHFDSSLHKLVSAAVVSVEEDGAGASIVVRTTPNV